MQLKKRHRKHTVTHYLPRCWYCGDVLTRASRSIDHVVPQCAGGGHQKENLVPCCKRCNNEKDCRTVEGYRRFLFDRTGKHVVFWGER